MRRQTLVVSVVAALSAALVFGVAGAVAKPGNGNGGNGVNAHNEASKACVAQKKELGNKTFKSTWGKHAMRTCKRETTDEVQAEAKNAAQECKAEQADPGFADTHGGATFEEFYGTNEPNENGTNGAGANAFGKCVSGKVHAAVAEDQEDLLNAAQECKAERKDPDFAAGHDGESFADFYGTNHNKKNAFGKCVSQKAHEDETGGDEDTTS